MTGAYEYNQEKERFTKNSGVPDSVFRKDTGKSQLSRVASLLDRNQQYTISNRLR
jgi:hypothetical protein